jgi:hypothetical protein
MKENQVNFPSKNLGYVPVIPQGFQIAKPPAKKPYYIK